MALTYSIYNREQGPYGRIVFDHRVGAEKHKCVDYFRRRKYNLSLPIQPYLKYHRYIRTNEVTFCKDWDENENITFAYSGLDFGLFQRLGIYDAFNEAEAKAKESFYSNAKKFDSNIAVTVAELPKTLALIASSAARLATAASRLKRFDVHGAFQALGITNRNHLRKLGKQSRNFSRKPIGRRDFASQAWLEMTYGWQPLLQEIEAAANDLSEAWDEAGADILIRGAGKVSGPAIHANDWAGSDTVYKECSETARVGYVIYADVFDTSQRHMSGAGVQDLASVAWELTPFSFVIDWFIPIGNWISSLTALDGLKFIKGSRSFKYEVIGSAFTPKGTEFGGYKQLQDLYCSQHVVDFRRSVMQTFPDNNFMRLSNFSEVVSPHHSASALALLHQVFGRK